MTTVLIVEDEPITLRVFSKILSKRGGFDVKHTEDVEEIIQIAQAGEADIILMDLSLTNSVYQGKLVDGIQLAQILKANPQTAKLPIILAAINVIEADGEHFCKLSGADDYISKPVVDSTLFVERIRAVLAK